MSEAEKLECSVCHEKRTKINFRWNTRTGFRTECKECEKTVLRCARCKEVKPHDAFRLMKSIATGRDSWCMSCRSDHTTDRYRQSAEYREKQKSYSRSGRAVAWRRQYNSRPDVKRRQKKYHRELTNFLYHNDVLHRLKVKARSMVHHAIKSGRLIVPDVCQSPGKYAPKCVGGKPEAHHHRGYWPRAAWTDVEWLCKGCHAIADQQQRDSGHVILVRDDSNPIYAAMAARVDNALEMLGITEMDLFNATIQCAGEDECDTFLLTMEWLAKNGYKITKGS